MLAKVSPAFISLMIDGQSCWGIFPLLLDLSISRTFGCSSVSVFWIATHESSNDDAEATPRNNRLENRTARVTIAAGQLAEA